MRIVLLDDCGYVALLCLYLARTETTQLYTLLAKGVADAEICAVRRRRDMSASRRSVLDRSRHNG